jgi:hypothetical protein
MIFIRSVGASQLLSTIDKKYAHDNIVAVAGYLLGEVGVNVCEQVCPMHCISYIFYT